MAVETDAAERVAGLDRLELGPRKESGLARRLWKGTWPKLLAIAIVVGAWQLVVLAEWRPVFVLPSPARMFDELVQVVATASFWAFAWRSLMAGELLVIVPGALSIGVRLQGARDLNDAPGLLAHVITALCIGILFSAADKALRRRWGPAV